MRQLRKYRRNEELSRAEFEALRLATFRKLVRHANRHSPYYATVIKDRGIAIDTCTPADFPVLTKATLMANFDAIVTDRRVSKQAIAEFLTRSTDPNDLFLDEFHVIHTSGSSGEIGYFVYSNEDWQRGMAQGMRRRSIRTPRVGFRRLRLGFYGAIGGHFAAVSMMSAATQGLSRLLVKVGLYEVNEPLPLIVQQPNEFQPDILSGYTSALTMLAARQREGALRIKPVFISTGGESMSPAQRALLEQTFGCPAVSGYGSSEHLMMGISGPGQSTMILLDDDLIYEMREDHSLVTNLFNFTLPLIRYRMADILRPVEGASSRPPYLEIHSIVGRNEESPMFLNRDGVQDFISPHTINEIFVAGVTRFQMRLRGPESFQFAVCLDTTLVEAQRAEAVAGVERRLREILDQKRMNNVTFEVAVVDDIPVNPRSRKFKLIVAN